MRLVEIYAILAKKSSICYILATTMKAAIHPTYFTDAKLICACGNVVTAGSTMQEIHIELCSKCHPFYTGKQKLLDTARRVEKFQEKSSAMTANRKWSRSISRRRPKSAVRRKLLRRHKRIQLHSTKLRFEV